MRPRKSFACACCPHGCVASESLVNVKATALVNHGPWNSEALVRIVTLPRGHSSIKLPVLRGAPTEIGWDLFSPLDCKLSQRCRSTSTWTWTLVPGHRVPRHRLFISYEIHVWTSLQEGSMGKNFTTKLTPQNSVILHGSNCVCDIFGDLQSGDTQNSRLPNDV